MSWSATLLAALARWGYLGLGLGVFLESAGLPVPGETALIAAAFGSAHGVLSLPIIIAVAFVCSVLGDNLGFALGRRLGRTWLELHGPRVGITPARLERVDAFFVRFGPMAVAAARFVAGVRVVVAFVAGTTRMDWGVFVRYNVLGAAAWATSVSLVGYAVGRGYSGVAKIEGRVGSILLVAVPVIVVAAWALLRVRRRLESETHAPPRPMASSREPLTVMTRSWRTILLASAAFVVTFVAVAEEVSERDTDPFDAMVRGFALAHQTPALTTLATALSFTGSALVLGAVTLAAIAWLWQRGARREGMTLFVSGMLTLAGVPALKLAFHRTRPAGALLYERLGYSFPSGHAMSSMALALTMTYLLQQQRVVPKGSVLVAVLFSLCVGVSRICLDVHWASDVVGGWSIGFGIAAACTAGCEWSASRNAQPIA